MTNINLGTVAQRFVSRNPRRLFSSSLIVREKKKINKSLPGVVVFPVDFPLGHVLIVKTATYPLSYPLLSYFPYQNTTKLRPTLTEKYCLNFSIGS